MDTLYLYIYVLDGVLAGQSIPHVHVHILPRRPGDFADNDDVYQELQTHDKKRTGWRTEAEMIEEAKIFRDYLKGWLVRHNLITWKTMEAQIKWKCESQAHGRDKQSSDSFKNIMHNMWWKFGDRNSLYL